mmetsp:Transcript_14177/g.42130  ORF Transcript_14177/g.42130 Transcript_14177/m.42130 type:complete len:232 (-) Transcript_14177:13-708(-)
MQHSRPCINQGRRDCAPAILQELARDFELEGPEQAPHRGPVVLPSVPRYLGVLMDQSEQVTGEPQQGDHPHELQGDQHPGALQLLASQLVLLGAVRLAHQRVQSGRDAKTHAEPEAILHHVGQADCRQRGVVARMAHDDGVGQLIDQCHQIAHDIRHGESCDLPQRWHELRNVLRSQESFAATRPPRRIRHAPAKRAARGGGWGRPPGHRDQQWRWWSVAAARTQTKGSCT